MIEVRHLSHNFGPYWALKDCTFKLGKGDFLFLTGPSGAGKSTLLRLLFADLAVQRGNASVAGFSLANIKNNQIPLLRRSVSVVFQNFKILPYRSVYDNVILPLQVRGMKHSHADHRVKAVVRALELEKRLHTACGELSGGEQQRVAVARSFVVNPQVLLADEPTGNLDPDLSFKLMDLFKQFQAYGTTMIVATHSQELLQRHPEAKIIRLEEGAIKQANWADATIFRGADELDRQEKNQPIPAHPDVAAANTPDAETAAGHTTELAGVSIQQHNIEQEQLSRQPFAPPNGQNAQGNRAQPHMNQRPQSHPRPDTQQQIGQPQIRQQQQAGHPQTHQSSEAMQQRAEAARRVYSQQPDFIPHRAGQNSAGQGNAAPPINGHADAAGQSVSRATHNRVQGSTSTGKTAPNWLKRGDQK